MSSLKTKQKEAISSFLKGRDVFVCLPTGYGKSLCFVLLPLVCDYLRGQKNGSTVICVSPLTSLMMEQKAKYTHYGLSVEFVGELQHDLQSKSAATIHKSREHSEKSTVEGGDAL